MASERLNTQMLNAAERAGGVLRSRYGIWGLALISFAESALPVPLITDPFLLAYIIADRTRALQGVVVTTIASVAGGVAAYFIAVGFFEVVLTPLMSPATSEYILTTATQFEEGAFLLTLTGAITPIPYTFVAIAAGLVQSSLVLFIVASVLGRGFRYALEGYLMYRLGEQAKRIIKKQIIAVSIVCAIAIVLYLVYKL